MWAPVALSLEFTRPCGQSAGSEGRWALGRLQDERDPARRR